jgi:hypothetical protein
MAAAEIPQWKADGDMAEETRDGFQVARLIPVSGIGNAVEAEMRATSALLAVVSVVRDLSLAMFSPQGASAARKATVETFIETKFKLRDGTVVRPDGLVQISYGASTWRALMEVKTGDNPLQADQLLSYLNVAREQGIDAVVSVSNEIAVGTEHPCEGVKVKANSKVRLAHLAWTEILALAVRAKVHRGVSDPEQAWILGELIRYLEHPASGALDFTDMGAHWTAVRDGARTATLHKTGDDLRAIVHRWDQLIRFAALRLGSSTGVDVQPVVPRSHADPRVRFGYLADELSGSGLLDATLRVPGSAGDIRLVADLRARQLTASTDVTAPGDRRNRGRVSWLLRQLGPATPGAVMVEAWPRLTRQAICAPLDAARNDPELLLDPDKRDLLRFRIVQRAEMGQSRKDGSRSPGFIQSVTGLVDAFYGQVLQQIVPWTAPPPQARPSAPRPKELTREPIADRDDLEDAVEAARGTVADDAGDQDAATATDSYVEAPIATDAHPVG